jgi:hypothetical protein
MTGFLPTYVISLPGRTLSGKAFILQLLHFFSIVAAPPTNKFLLSSLQVVELAKKVEMLARGYEELPKDTAL